MTQKPRQYVRLARLTEASQGAGDVTDLLPLEPPRPLRGRARARTSHFGRRFASTAAVLECGDEDELVNATRPILLAHLPEMIADVANEIARGDQSREYDPIEREHLRAWLSQWLELLVIGPMGEAGGERAAAVGLSYLRPRNGAAPAKARFALFAMETAQTRIFLTLATGISAPKVLASASAAWSRRVAVHLDLLLALHASLDGGRHWY